MKKRVVVFLILCILLFFYRQNNIQTYIAKLNSEKVIAELGNERLAENIIHAMCSPLYSKDLKMIILGDISDVWMEGQETTIVEHNQKDRNLLYRYKKKNSGNLINVSVKNERKFVVDTKDLKVIGWYIGK